MRDLIDRAKQGLLSRQELDAIAGRLADQDTFEEVVSQLEVMRFAGDARYRLAVERYLGFRQDTGVAAQALGVLCLNWDLADEYLDWLLMFIEGVDWDLQWGVREVRSEAFLIAGGYLQVRRSRALLDLLIRVAEDETERQDARSDAARALYEALATRPDYAPGHIAADDPLFARTIRAARQRRLSEPDLPPREGRRPVSLRKELPAYAEPYLAGEALGSELVDRARRCGLSPAELDAIARDLDETTGDASVRERLLALMYAGDASLRRAVERLLPSASARTAGLALLVLCAGWRLTRGYLDWLVRFIEEGPPELSRLAFTIAGAYLATRRSRVLLELLVRIAKHEGRPEPVRAQAVIALHRALDSVLPTERDLSEQDVTYALREAERRLRAE